jgi:regulatory protein
VEPTKKTSNARVQALRLLTVRDRSVQELRDRLQRQFAQEEIEETLDYLERIGYLDDLRFAKNHVQYRNRHRPTGNYLLRLELRSKGVRDSYIEQALNSSALEYELALSLAKQRLGRLERVDALARMRRVCGLLQRRGFPATVARRVVCELLDRDPENEYN